MFVSNHQTYFADVVTFLHIFCAVKWGKNNRLGIPYYLLNPFTRVNYVAAEATMKGSWISRFFALAGALTVKRTWQRMPKRQGKDWILLIPVRSTGPWRKIGSSLFRRALPNLSLREEKERH